MVSVELQNDEFVCIREMLEEELESLNEALQVYKDVSFLEQIKDKRKDVVQLLEKFL